MFKNFGLIIRQMEGMSIRAQRRQRNRERMISRANDLIRGNAEKRSTENPSITEKALMAIPRPVAVNIFLMAVG